MLLYFLILVVVKNQLTVGSGLLMMNSSQFNGKLSISLSYTGNLPFQITFSNKYTIRLNPHPQRFELYYDQFQINLLYNSRDQQQLWLGFKTEIAPILLSPTVHFIPAVIANHAVLVPVGRYPLQILPKPLHSINSCNMLLFLSNSFQHSVVYYSTKLIQSLKVYWGLKSDFAEYSEIMERSAKYRVYDGKQYIDSENLWGKAWLLTDANLMYSMGKIVRNALSQRLPSQIQISIRYKNNNQQTCIFATESKTFSQMTSISYQELLDLSILDIQMGL